jgi:CheY-like chemotaxis protein
MFRQAPLCENTMSEPTNVVLLVDPDQRARALLAEQLKPLGCDILQASDGVAALRILSQRPDVKLVLTELYLATGDDECLIHAIRRERAFRKTRTVAHTHRSLPADREWAMRAGADAYLIKPTRAERVRYVVARLTTTRGANAAFPETSSAAISRRDSLDSALLELEGGKLAGTSSIVFSRVWWEQLSRDEQATYRKRAKKARISLRSDSILGTHFVEVRGPSRSDVALSTERPESPYRR